jgi:large subunit ribosomal protein L28e
MSSDLVWEIVKSNNSFLVKRKLAQFTREPNNLTNLNSFKYSGLANAKCIGVAAAADKKGVVLSVKTKSTKPAKSIAASKIHASGVRRVAKTIKAITEKRHYRADLQKVIFVSVF